MFLKKINEHLNNSLAEAGFITARPLQKQCIAKIKSGADLITIAPEKCGKTSSLVIALIQQLKNAVDDVPRALIVVPNADAAEAMKELFDLLGKHTDLRVFCVFNKHKLDDLRDKIYFGSDVVIGTAPVLNDLYSKNGLNLTGLKYFAIDDAAQCIKNEIVSQIDRLSSCLPKSQYIILSNELNGRIERYAERTMKSPILIEASEEDTADE